MLRMLEKARLIVVLALPWLFAGPWALPAAAGEDSVRVAAAPVAEARFSRGLLWKVEGEGAPPSYIFGTVHLDDAGVWSLPEAVARAFDDADTFSMEVVLDDGALAAMREAMFLTDGRTLDALVGADLYGKAVAEMERRGMPEMVTQRMRPWALSIIISLPQAESMAHLDERLRQRAVAQGKPVHALETVAEQLSALAGLPEDVEVGLLREALRDRSATKDALEAGVRLYLARDLAGLVAWQKQAGEQAGRAAADFFQQSLIDDRNLRMVDRMAPRLAEGNAFIAVGALHLPGEKGVLNLLQQGGYRVSAVY